jgi:hypothetical protein
VGSWAVVYGVVETNLVFYPSAVFWALLILPFLGPLCTVGSGIIAVSFVFPSKNLMQDLFISWREFQNELKIPCAAGTNTGHAS